MLALLRVCSILNPLPDWVHFSLLLSPHSKSYADFYYQRSSMTSAARHPSLFFYLFHFFPLPCRFPSLPWPPFCRRSPLTITLPTLSSSAFDHILLLRFRCSQFRLFHAHLLLSLYHTSVLPSLPWVPPSGLFLPSALLLISVRRYL